MGLKLYAQLLAALLLCAVVASCSFSGLDYDPSEVFDDPEIYRVGDEIAQGLITADTEPLLKNASQLFLDAEGIDAAISTLVEFLPAGDGVTADLYYAEQLAGLEDDPTVVIYLLAYEVIDGERFFNLSLAFYEEKPDSFRLARFDANHIAFLPSRDFKLSLEGKSPLHFVVLGLALIIPVFMIFTAIACFRNENVRRKWLWIPFILIGLWGIEFNWTTGYVVYELFHVFPDGSISFNFIAFSLLGVTAVKMGLLSPWVIGLGSPIGALLYWFWGKRGSRLDRADEILA